MKIALKFFAVIASFVLLTGCPYYSDVSLSPGKHADAKFLVGTWLAAGYTYGEAEHYTVTEEKGADGNVLKIVKSNPTDGTETIYKGYLSNIDETLFLNVWEISEGEELASIYFHKIEKKNETEFVLYEVTENIREQFNNPDALVKFFRENMNKSYFYTTGEITYLKYD